MASDGPHGNIFDQIHFEGLVGLAFPEMASTGGLPVYDNLYKQGLIKRNEFSFYMAEDQTLVEEPYLEDGSPTTAKPKVRNVSAIFFGGVDPRFFVPPIHMIPVVREHYWEVKLDSFWVGNRKFCCNDNTNNYAIIDSGTSFNTLPAREIDLFFAMVPPMSCDAPEADLSRNFPNLTYVLNGVEIVLTPEMYLVRSGNDECKPAYMQIDVPSEYGHAYILGVTAFMRHYYTVFRRSQNGDPAMVGIAKAKHTSEGASYLSSLMSDHPGVDKSYMERMLHLQHRNPTQTPKTKSSSSLSNKNQTKLQGGGEGGGEEAAKTTTEGRSKKSAAPANKTVGSVVGAGGSTLMRRPS
eukprot:GHVU01207746.1.p1 GENE.GHVU01207746.1~~GHVU01207746.1.p1  ORF type:complete len:384 (-),score=79.48 GHVU01207746.1:373-1428(-)